MLLESVLLGCLPTPKPFGSLRWSGQYMKFKAVFICLIKMIIKSEQIVFVNIYSFKKNLLFPITT